jgi:hypothetical protein
MAYFRQDFVRSASPKLARQIGSNSLRVPGISDHAASDKPSSVQRSDKRIKMELPVIFLPSPHGDRNLTPSFELTEKRPFRRCGTLRRRAVDHAQQAFGLCVSGPDLNCDGPLTCGRQDCFTRDKLSDSVHVTHPLHPCCGKNHSGPGRLLQFAEPRFDVTAQIDNVKRP